jgi:hypothetical protein
MTTTVRALALALALIAVALPAWAHSTAADSAALQFHGFQAGARLEELDARLRRLGGDQLRCDRATADRRVTECRGRFTDSTLGAPVEVWISAIDSVAGIITLSGSVSSIQLDRWRAGLEASYGRVGARGQGAQWMMQWVRRRRMLRLTWRMDGREKVASISLVDGRVLDAWGRSRARTSLVVGDSTRL